MNDFFIAFIISFGYDSDLFLVLKPKKTTESMIIFSTLHCNCSFIFSFHSAFILARPDQCVQFIEDAQGYIIINFNNYLKTNYY